MIYVYDILLNWFQKEQLVDFFEWELNDELEHVKKMPLIKVDSLVIKDLYHSHIQIEKVLLDKIKNKTECYFHNDIDIIDYACIMSDGHKCVAIEFDENGNSLYKSTLLVDEEEEVLELLEELTLTVVSYQVKKTLKEYDYLTRREKDNKKYILNELQTIYKEKNIEKMMYLYEEYFSDNESNLDSMYQKIVKNIDCSYSKIHEGILEILRLTSAHKS